VVNEAKTYTGGAVLVAVAIAVGFLTWQREFGEIAAGGILAAACAVLGFCVIAFLRSELQAQTTPRGRVFWLVGRVVFWVLVSVIPCVLAWLVAWRIGHSLR
jgi:hypothetical protein